MASQHGRTFGVRPGDFGFFSSLLMACFVGVLSFFLATFLAIVGIAIYNGLGHSLNFADSYKFIALPAGCLMLIASLVFFGTLWLRGKFRHG